MSSPWRKYLKLFLLVLREKKLPVSPTFAAVGEGDEARVEKGNQKHIIQPGMAFIEHLLWVVIMCGAIRNTDYRTAVYSPKRQCPSQRFFSLVSSHSSAWLHRSLSRGCGLCYIVCHCRRHSPSMLQTTLRALTDTFTSMHTAHRSGIVFLI